MEKGAHLMSPEAASYPGRFVWHEIVTPDVERSKAFYGQLCGWSFEDLTGVGGTYPIILAGGEPQGGLVAASRLPFGDVAPQWLGYVSVADVDRAAGAARAGGGSVRTGPLEVPGVGRLALLADPAGAVVCAFRSAVGDPPEGERQAPGAFCWDQLNTPDAARAKAFYRKVFGWRDRPFADGAGIEVFGREDGKEAASVMQAPPGVPGHWLPYVVVETLESARDRAVKLGGQVRLDRTVVQGLGVIAVISDDLGASIGLYSAS
jgi:predicted enzyme related to lactoylglutathione lyase